MYNVTAVDLLRHRTSLPVMTLLQQPIIEVQSPLSCRQGHFSSPPDGVSPCLLISVAAFDSEKDLRLENAPCYCIGNRPTWLRKKIEEVNA
ncbi:hypothetical protein TNIN_478091 [Trichonephila inaurata madagascariensis]|uniref:Uncharacterized protein n=1 Tax=Trichonephila inaurata madagascariensis TaxID=2747483 RepID=A0A8X7CMM6_9ARAC|nr:hypothetical protein TNIN_478091 [Trichonephila inaurata madagascariensis]